MVNFCKKACCEIIEEMMGYNWKYLNKIFFSNVFSNKNNSKHVFIIIIKKDFKRYIEYYVENIIYKISKMN